MEEGPMTEEEFYGALKAVWLDSILDNNPSEGESMNANEALIGLTEKPTAETKSFYVYRERDERFGWTGSIRSRKQAEKEVAAWREGGWEAEIHPNTEKVRAAVRAWEKAR